VIRVLSVPTTTTTTQPYESYTVSGLTSPTNANGEYRIASTNAAGTTYTNGIYKLDQIAGGANSYWQLYEASWTTLNANSDVGKWPHTSGWSIFAGSGSITVTPNHAYSVSGFASDTNRNGIYIQASFPDVFDVGFTNAAGRQLRWGTAGNGWMAISGGPAANTYHEGYYNGGYTTPWTVPGRYWEDFTYPADTGTVTVVAKP
jgi:hypothetical protein